MTPIRTPFYEDRDFHFGRTYYYAVSTVGKMENPQAESQVSDFISIVTRDIFPPAPPASFTAVLDGPSVLLMWSPSPSADVVGYRITRLDKDLTVQLLQGEVISALSYRDSGAEKISRYRIVAVDAYGNESRAVEAAVDIE